MQRYFCALTLCVVAIVALSPQSGYGLAESTACDGSNAQAVHELGFAGQDVNVGLISSRNTRITHEAFKDSNDISHAFSYDFSGEGIAVSSHDTWVAGIIASKGGISSNPNDIGVAPESDIHSARIADNNNDVYYSYLSNALEGLVINNDCRVVATGASLGTEGDGQTQWTIIYDYYAYEHNAIFAIPAGNSGSQVDIFGDAYNGITTGGLIVTEPDVYLKVGSSSGSGPTADGRRKPDVVAPSQSQTMPSGGSDTSWYEWTAADGATSLSTPHTAGIAALLLSLADTTAEPNDNKNEVIKAVIVNSAFPNIIDKSGNQTNPADPNNTWHPQRSYGRIDCLRAHELLDANQITPDVNTTQQKGWAFGTVEPGSEHIYTIIAQSNCRLIATLNWNRRIEWTENKPPNGKIDAGELDAYLANLDMEIYQPNEPNIAIFSEEVSGLDPNNNLEKCDILLETDGNYTIKIINNSDNGETASYGLAFELYPLIDGDFSPADYIVDYEDLSTLAYQWLTENDETDLIEDGITNMLDFAAFVSNWLEIDPTYYQQ
ncbi:MAG: S8 family serine peptidase [Planctomycetes bacterium]|nr:S8 family serine peptidase [Planctomycetota bacterium]